MCIYGVCYDNCCKTSPIVLKFGTHVKCTFINTAIHFGINRPSIANFTSILNVKLGIVLISANRCHSASQYVLKSKSNCEIKFQSEFVHHGTVCWKGINSNCSTDLYQPPTLNCDNRNNLVGVKIRRLSMARASYEYPCVLRAC
jgi:hypothetical protein